MRNTIVERVLAWSPRRQLDDRRLKRSHHRIAHTSIDEPQRGRGFAFAGGKFAGGKG